jgi:hypothetical protein
MSAANEADGNIGERILNAATSNENVIAASLIRDNKFIVFQQVDPEQAASGTEVEGNFSVVLAEVDNSLAVVCFSEESTAANFAQEVAEEVPEGYELPAIRLDGNTLLDGLPDDCGLLFNPGSDIECFFPPGSLG